MGKMVFKVPEVSCMHCVRQIEGALGKLDGVQDVNVDLEEKTVTVMAEPSMQQSIIAAIEDAGFDVLR